MALLQEVQDAKLRAEKAVTLAERHEEQISGRQGIIIGLGDLSQELKGVKRALYTAGGGFVLAAVGFGFAAMRLTGTG